MSNKDEEENHKWVVENSNPLGTVRVFECLTKKAATDVCDLANAGFKEDKSVTVSAWRQLY